MTELLAVVAITFFAVISPGPDFAMVSRNSLLLSRRSRVLTALGIGVGVCVRHLHPARGGAADPAVALAVQSHQAGGAAYLIFLGIKMLRAKPATAEVLAEQPALSSLGRCAPVSDQCAQPQDHHLHRQPVHAGGAAADAAGGPARLRRLHRAGPCRLVQRGGDLLLHRLGTGSAVGGAPLDRSGVWRAAGGIRHAAGADPADALRRGEALLSTPTVGACFHALWSAFR